MSNRAGSSLPRFAALLRAMLLALIIALPATARAWSLDCHVVPVRTVSEAASMPCHEEAGASADEHRSGTASPAAPDKPKLPCCGIGSACVAVAIPPGSLVSDAHHPLFVTHEHAAMRPLPSLDHLPDYPPPRA